MSDRRNDISRVSVAAILIVTVLCFSQPVEAVGIVGALEYDEDFRPAYDADGALLQQMMTYAASQWEGMVEHSWDMEWIRYSYDNSLPATTLARTNPESVASHRVDRAIITVNPNFAWFFDPTPNDDSEFDMVQTLYRDLTPPDDTDWFRGDPPEILEVSYAGGARTAPDPDADPNALGAHDMVSVLLHEFGHCMGYIGTDHYVSEVADDDIDLPGALIGGHTAAVRIPGLHTSGDVNDWAHLAPDDALMNRSIGDGIRRRISALDLFASAAGSPWGDGDIDLLRIDFVSGTDWNTPGCWLGNRVPEGIDHVSIRTQADTFAISMSDDGSARDITIESGNSLTTADNRLDVYGPVVIDGNATEIEVAGGGVLKAWVGISGDGRLVVRGGGQLDISESSSSIVLDAGGVLRFEAGALPVEVHRDVNLENASFHAGSGTEIAIGNDLICGVDSPDAIEFEGATVTIGNNLTMNWGVMNIIESTVDVNNWTGEAVFGRRILDAEVNLRGGRLHVTDVIFGDTRDCRITMEPHGGSDAELHTTELWRGSITVGKSGNAEFIQNGGTVGRKVGSTFHPDIEISALGTSYSTWTLNSGSVTAESLIVGGYGYGFFSQNGGTVTVHGTLILGEGSGSLGTYNLNGGALHVEEIDRGDGGGAFNYTAGVLNMGSTEQRFDCLNVGATAGVDSTLDLVAEDLRANDVRVGLAGRADLTLSACDLLVSDVLSVGFDSVGTLDQSGGVTSVDTIEVGKNVGGSGSYYLRSGSLRADILGLGYDARGRVTQEGGTATIATLKAGVYNDSWLNTYHQTGGRADVSSELQLGVYFGSRGEYWLDGSDLTVVLEPYQVSVGLEGAGLITHTGGHHNVLSELRIATGGGEGAYNLSGGRLDSPATVVGVDGAAVFNHSGGTHDTGTLRVGAGSATAAQYNLSGVSLLMTSWFRVGDGSEGLVTKTGGSAHVAWDLCLGNADSDTGGYDQSGGATYIGRNLNVGHADNSIGNLIQSGGSINVDGDVRIARGAGSIGTCELGDGPAPGITQHVVGDLHIGYGHDSDATYHIKGKVLRVGEDWTHGGELTVDGTVFIGGNGAGRMQIDGGGKLIAGGIVTVGSPTDSGILELDGGEIEGVGSLVITGGTGTLSGRGGITVPVVNNHEIRSSYMTFEADVSGAGELLLEEALDTANFYSSATFDGAVSNNGQIVVANFGADVARFRGGMTGTGSVEVSGKLEIESDLAAGGMGTSDVAPGTIVQHGGTTVDVDAVSVGPFGLYELHDTAVLDVASVTVNGDFDHEGGEHEASAVTIAKSEWDYMRMDPARYRLKGGSLSTAVLEIGGEAAEVTDPPMPMVSSTDGELVIDNAAAVLTVSQRLVLNQTAIITAAPGAQIHMTGSALENYSTDPEALAGLGELELIFEGGPEDVDPMEVAGQDYGELPVGLKGNFALGTLTVGSAVDIGRVQLVDLVDNQPGFDGGEAIYVDHLNIAAGSTLDLGGLNLYYGTATFESGAPVVGTAIYWPTTHTEVDGTPVGFDVSVTEDVGGSGGMGVGGMAGGGDARALSGTVGLDETEVAAAIAEIGGAEAFITVKLFYDEHELDILEIDEDTLRPYWWDETAELWVLCGTTTGGLPGEGVFAGIDSDPGAYGIGYCGLNTEEDYVWANINHASTYGTAGTPEPVTLILMAAGLPLLLRRRRRRRTVRLLCV